MTRKNLFVLTSEKEIPGGRLQEVIGLYIPFSTEGKVRKIARKTEKVVFRPDHEDICLHKTCSVLTDKEDNTDD